jgi:uncharacterized membrane protein
VWAYNIITKLSVSVLAPLFKQELPEVVYLIIAILDIVLIGILANWWISKKLFIFIEKIIAKLPGISNIYSTIRDTLKSLAGEEKKFDTVVLVHLTEDVARLGFLTVRESPFKTEDGKRWVGVYFPQTMQVSGDMFWVPEEKVQEVDMPVDKALTLILSGGASA